MPSLRKNKVKDSTIPEHLQKLPQDYIWQMPIVRQNHFGQRTAAVQFGIKNCWLVSFLEILRQMELLTDERIGSYQVFIDNSDYHQSARDVEPAYPQWLHIVISYLIIYQEEARHMPQTGSQQRGPAFRIPFRGTKIAAEKRIQPGVVRQKLGMFNLLDSLPMGYSSKAADIFVEKAIKPMGLFDQVGFWPLGGAVAPASCNKAFDFLMQSNNNFVPFRFPYNVMFQVTITGHAMVGILVEINRIQKYMVIDVYNQWAGRKCAYMVYPDTRQAMSVIIVRTTEGETTKTYMNNRWNLEPKEKNKIDSFLAVINKTLSLPLR